VIAAKLLEHKVLGIRTNNMSCLQVSAEALEQHVGVSKGKYTIGLGQVSDCTDK
jgi:alpha/beta superfamily hydrolase